MRCKCRLSADPTIPPGSGKAAKTGIQSKRLEEVVTRIGLDASSTENIITKTQALIDHAAKKGKDTSALQTALSAYKSALELGLPF